MTAHRNGREAMRSIMWFRNDLRVHDNAVLYSVLESVNNRSGELVCVYCFDPRHYKVTKFGSKKTGIFRNKFLLESVQNLRQKLKVLGSELLVTISKPDEFMSLLVNEANKETCVFVAGEVTSEEISAEQAVERAIKTINPNNSLRKVYGSHSLYHPQDIPYLPIDTMPNTFTPYKEKVEKMARIRPLIPTPTVLPALDLSQLSPELQPSLDYLPTLNELGFTDDEIQKHAVSSDPRGVMTFVGGEDAGLQRMQTWMFDHDHLKDYFDIRNGMLGEAYSSKFSPWLAAGCLSPRLIYYETKRYENERKISNKSTYWLTWELLVRDFYHSLCMKYGKRVFYPEGATGRSGCVSWDSDDEKVQRWRAGNTGMPLVDANMRELAATGWMSNRGRQNVASYLVLDYNIDWRIGADHFESLLLDHDVCSNYGNWNAAAGLTGGRVNKFNIVKQSKDYDEHGDYIRHWCPELRHIPAPLIFEPWKLSRADQEKYNCKIGVDYPARLAVEGKSGGDDGDAAWKYEDGSKVSGKKNSKRERRDFDNSKRSFEIDGSNFEAVEQKQSGS